MDIELVESPRPADDQLPPPRTEGEHIAFWWQKIPGHPSMYKLAQRIDEAITAKLEDARYNRSFRLTKVFAELLPRMPTTNPRHTHDCDKCIFLGTWREFDLYYCTQGGTRSTVVARYGSEGPEYTSAGRSDPIGLQYLDPIDAGWMLASVRELK